MNTTGEEESTQEGQGPLAFSIRQRRQWYGKNGLSQVELAMLAGTSTRRLRAYEEARALPEVVRRLLGVAAALGVSIEELIDDQQLEAVRTAVERRRARRDGTAREQRRTFYGP